MPAVHPVSSMRPLLIWDIDGTLLEPRGVGRGSLNAVFQQLYHIPDGFEGLDFAGATDHDLWTQAATRGHVPLDDYPIFFRHYALHLRKVLRETPLMPLPGVVALMVSLSNRGWPMVLGTGNIRAGAYAKLSAAGLAPYFPAGGFSQPGRSRAAVIAGAATTVPETVTPIVIGDTPRDIEAGHANQFRVLTVATGRFLPDQLQSAGADAVLENLHSEDAFWHALGQFVR